MRFKLTLLADKAISGDLLPFNYQYELLGVIYKVLSHADPDYSTWLHGNGYRADHKLFKLFTYSRFFIPEFRVDKECNCLQIKSNTVDWYLSFLPEKSAKEFVRGVFVKQAFLLGNREHAVLFRVQQVEALEAPEYRNEMTFETLSPMCVTRREGDRISYLSPVDPGVKDALLEGLVSRYKAYAGCTYTGDRTFGFTVLNEPKPKLITIRAGTLQQSRVKGYMCRFRMNAPTDLMRIMYECGIGEKCSLGFGMCVVRDFSG